MRSDRSQRLVRVLQTSSLVLGVVVACTVADKSDYEFTDDEWAALWLTAERQGLGASRSQGFGRFTVTQWDRID